MKTYFVTGTDTDVGKTVVSALLARQLKAFYWKPVQSGTSDVEDKNTVQELAGLPEEKILPCVYEFSAPLSPHEAADLEGRKISMADIELPDVDGNLIIEGAGGVFVPLNDKDMMIDLIEKLACEVIVVARGSLGTINHTLLTLSVLRTRNINVKGVILNGELNPNNKKAIEQFGNVPILGLVQQMKDLDFAALNTDLFKL